jgi:hypothetical protein
MVGRATVLGSGPGVETVAGMLADSLKRWSGRIDALDGGHRGDLPELSRGASS